MSLRTLKFILPGLIVAANVASADLDDLKHPKVDRQAESFALSRYPRQQNRANAKTHRCNQECGANNRYLNRPLQTAYPVREVGYPNGRPFVWMSMYTLNK